jgi:hypothetical protein
MKRLSNRVMSRHIPDKSSARGQTTASCLLPQTHTLTYLRGFDADAAGVDWSLIAQLVLSLNPAADLDRAQLVYHAHLARARWMTRVGYPVLQVKDRGRSVGSAGTEVRSERVR